MPPRLCIVWCRDTQMKQATALLGTDWEPRFRNPKYWDYGVEAMGPGFAFPSCPNLDSIRAAYAAEGIEFTVFGETKAPVAVEELEVPGLSPAQVAALTHAGMWSRSALRQATDADLLGVPRVGRVAIAAIRKVVGEQSRLMTVQRGG